VTGNEKAVGFLLTSQHPESLQVMVVFNEAGISFSSMDNEIENALPTFFPFDENRRYVGLNDIKSFVENFKKKGKSRG